MPPFGAPLTILKEEMSKDSVDRSLGGVLCVPDICDSVTYPLHHEGVWDKQAHTRLTNDHRQDIQMMRCDSSYFDKYRMHATSIIVCYPVRLFVIAIIP